MATQSGTVIEVRPPAALRRRKDLRSVGVFVLCALPVAAVLWAILGPVIAAIYVVAQTALLTFGLRRTYVPVLKLSADGLSYEPGRFQLRCRWDDVDGVAEVDLPSGRTEAFVLSRPALHWADGADVKAEVQERGWATIVPVGDFEPDWRTGRIGAAARQWAPHLVA